VVKLALAQHLLINVTADNVIRLVPPLVMNDSEARQLIDGLSPIIRAFLGRALT
jgi:acetylornithine/N-succinyldiaminopimelate aminotransferase